MSKGVGLMKLSLGRLFCSVLLLASLTNAQAPTLNKATQDHLAAAKAAAYRPGHDLTNLYETVCAPAMSAKGPVEPNPTEGGQTAPSLANRKVPPRSQWYTEPAKVFDNLYWLGSLGDSYSVPKISGDSTWAVTTSDGIILIDSGYDYSAKELITDGMKKMGLDPTQIKYVILSHVHRDRYFSSRYPQE